MIEFSCELRRDTKTIGRQTLDPLLSQTSLHCCPFQARYGPASFQLVECYQAIDDQSETVCARLCVCVFFHPKNMISSIFLTGYLLFLFYVQTGFVVQITNIKLELDGHTSLKYRFTCPNVLCKTTL